MDNEKKVEELKDILDKETKNINIDSGWILILLFILFLPTKKEEPQPINIYVNYNKVEEGVENV